MVEKNDMTTEAVAAVSKPKAQWQVALDLCVRKTRHNIRRLADEPKSAAWALDGDFFSFEEGFYEIGNWTSSFFTGMALLAWSQTEDEYFLKQVQRLAPHYHAKAFEHPLDTHHDLGFLYTLYSVALHKLTGDAAALADGIRAAELLAQRFNDQGGFIRAWGRMDTDEHANMAIIDCLMNLPLLHWATLKTGNQQYRDIAVRHADTVLENFIRPDQSLCHAYRFDPKTGAPLGPENFCGRGIDSYWARGAAWAIYGFALSYTYTGDSRYLNASVKLVKQFVTQLDAEVVPVWDFRLPPDTAPVRDTSAAVITVCGIQELARHAAADPELLRVKKALLEQVCAGCLDFNEACPGILKSGYGDKPAYSSWGDYFLMEALVREMQVVETFW